MLVEIFCDADDFCKFLMRETGIKRLGANNNVGRKPGLSISEVLTITIYYHLSGYKSFKAYYNVLIRGYERCSFTKLPSYNRFIELRSQMLVPLLLFVQMRALGKCDGLSITDSTSLEVCHVLRVSSHKLFKGLAKKGKTSTGWFYGFKFHCTINSRGEIINFFITPGNVSDNNPDVLNKTMQNVFGKVVGDRGYIGAFQQLYAMGIQLIHRLRKNMHSKLIRMFDKILLRKRGIIETVFGILKESLGLESSKNRSQMAYFTQIIATVAAYNFRPTKPMIFPAKLAAIAA